MKMSACVWRGRYICRDDTVTARCVVRTTLSSVCFVCLFMVPIFLDFCVPVFCNDCCLCVGGG